MADELIFTLRFNTKNAQQEAKTFTEQLHKSLQAALKPEIGEGVDLSRALGLKGVIDEMRQIDSQMKGLQKSLRTFNTERLQAMKLEAQIGQLRDKQGNIRHPQTGDFLSRVVAEDLVKSGAKGIDNTSEEIRQIDEAILANETKARQEVTKKLFEQAKLHAEISSSMKAQARSQAEQATKKTVDSETLFADLKKRRAANRRSSDLEEMLVGPRARHRQSRTTARKEAAQQFAAARRSETLNPGETFRNFMPGAERGPGEHGQQPKSKPPLGITQTASSFLALSSVLAPLNSQLGSVAMSAGFAAFQFGPVLAGLSLMSAGLASLRDFLTRAVSSTREAGLETVRWSRSTTALAVQMESFWNVIGIKTQLAFASVVDELTELSEATAKLPWDELIDGAAEASQILLELTNTLAKFYEGSPFGTLNRLQKQAGQEGSQLISFGRIIAASMFGLESSVQAIVGEGMEAFSPPKNEGIDFIHTPKFEFTEFQNLGRDIQKSIMQQAEMTPEERAIHDLHETLRAQTKSTEDTAENTSTLVERATQFIPQLGF